MIISPEAITWFLIGKKVDDKTLFRLAKYQGIIVPGSLRKSISNSFLQKGKQSYTTINNIKGFVKEIVNDRQFSTEVDNFDFSSKIDLSTPELNIEYIESGYSSFFRATNFGDNFFRYEIKNIFKIIKKIFSSENDDESRGILEKEILENGVFSEINLSNSIWIDIREKGIIHGVFSLNLVLYLTACADVQNKENGIFKIQIMLENLLSDIEGTDNKTLCSAFKYYILTLKYFLNKNGEKSTDAEIAELLDMELREYYLYKSGERNIPPKKMNSIIEVGDFFYHTIVFWKKLIEIHIQEPESKQLIVNLLNEYPKYLEIAQAQFNKYNNTVQKDLS